MNFLADAIIRARLEFDLMYGRRSNSSERQQGQQVVARFMGMQIVESPICLVIEPVRKHSSKGRGSYMWKGGYCKRIQKKWTKRFGTHEVPAFFISVDGECVVMHPSLVTKLKEDFDREQSHRN